jgi:hypothetical protein
MTKIACALFVSGLLCVGSHFTAWAADEQKVTGDELKKRAADVLDAVKDYASQQKVDYQKDVEQHIKSLSQSIDQMKEMASTKKGEALSKIESEISELMNKRDVVDQRLKELRSSGSQAWGEMKTGVENALESLQKAYEKSVSQTK